MYAAINSKNEKVFIEDATTDENYYCPCCLNPVIVKNCTVKRSHFAHKSFTECDTWYEMSDWHYDWQNKFPEKFIEVVIEEYGVKHRADIKVNNLVVEFQNSSISGYEFEERTEFYSNNNKLIWLFNLQDKSISEKRPRGESKTKHFIWFWAYKFNDLEYYGNKFDLFFQIGVDRIIKVVWNKQGFKYFGGYEYTVDGFMNYLRKLHKAEVIR